GSESKTGRGPDGRGAGMNQGQGETALGEDEIDQPDCDQASNVGHSPAEGCPRSKRMSNRYSRSHRLVSRFRSSQAFAAPSDANSGIKGTLALYDSSAPF